MYLVFCREGAKGFILGCAIGFRCCLQPGWEETKARAAVLDLSA